MSGSDATLKTYPVTDRQPTRSEASPSILVSILVLTHNDSQFLPACLESIKEHVSCFYEVILLDNGSSQGAVQDALRPYPRVRLIRSNENLGFNAGNNFAAAFASGKYLLLLNADTVLMTDVAPAVRLLESEPKIGVVGAQSHSNSRTVRPSTGRFPRAWHLWLFRGLWAKPRNRFSSDSRAYRVDWVEGSFLMTRAENWLGIGGFDTRNPLFSNDIDFCRATKDRGLAVIHCADVKYVHFGGYQVSRAAYVYAGFRNYHAKFSGHLEQLAADSILRIGLLVRLLTFGFLYLATRKEWAGEKWRSFLEVHRTWAQMNPKGRAI